MHGLGLLGTHVQLYDKTRKLPIYISIGHGLDSQTFEIPFASWWLGQLPLSSSAPCACFASCPSRVQQGVLGTAHTHRAAKLCSRQARNSQAPSTQLQPPPCCKSRVPKAEGVARRL